MEAFFVDERSPRRFHTANQGVANPYNARPCTWAFEAEASKGPVRRCYSSLFGESSFLANT